MDSHTHYHYKKCWDDDDDDDDDNDVDDDNDDDDNDDYNLLLIKGRCFTGFWKISSSTGTYGQKYDDHDKLDFTWMQFVISAIPTLPLALDFLSSSSSSSDPNIKSS